MHDERNNSELPVERHCSPRLMAVTWRKDAEVTLEVAIIGFRGLGVFLAYGSVFVVEVVKIPIPVS